MENTLFFQGKNALLRRIRFLRLGKSYKFISVFPAQNQQNKKDSSGFAYIPPIKFDKMEIAAKGGFAKPKNFCPPGAGPPFPPAG
ncbi:MAG: hypothetical protein ACOX6U_00010 [Oscillospiraceae bacterium]